MIIAEVLFFREAQKSRVISVKREGQHRVVLVLCHDYKSERRIPLCDRWNGMILTRYDFIPTTAIAVSALLEPCLFSTGWKERQRRACNKYASSV